MTQPTNIANVRRQRELDERIRSLRPAINRAADYLLARGIDPASAVCSPRARAIWTGRPEPALQAPRAVIF